MPLTGLSMQYMGAVYKCIGMMVLPNNVKKKKKGSRTITRIINHGVTEVIDPLLLTLRGL